MADPLAGTAAVVRRAPVVLRADPSRVVTRLLMPGQELVQGISRADAVINRVLALSDEQVSRTLAQVIRSYQSRHPDLLGTFADHFALLAHRLPRSAHLSAERRDLIGAYCTQESSVEAAALFNPSMVAHPDQTGLAAGELRFAMSVRAVGEGHISSIEFRTGVLSAATIRVDDPGRHLVRGAAVPTTMSREFLRVALADWDDAALAERVLTLLPDRFDAEDLSNAIRAVHPGEPPRGGAAAIVDRIRWIFAGNYRLRFPADRPLSERLIYPSSAVESHGMEDVRFTRFTDEDGAVSYRGTYTAFDGSNIAPQLLLTDDFRTFDIAQVAGPAARDKGMALFPRRVAGLHLALSRWDRESIGVASSVDGRIWGDPQSVLTPQRPWELIQLGNCGPPIETAAGWLVLTHGVGPMRTYGIGAMLLDLDDPTQLIGSLSEPLLTANEDERDGYVPNVVYSCGSVVHEDTVVVPYGCSDSSIRFAFVDLHGLLSLLR